MYVAENDCHKRESESARLREPLDANGVRIVHATMPRPGHDAMRGTRPVHDRHMILPAPPPATGTSLYSREISSSIITLELAAAIAKSKKQRNRKTVSNQKGSVLAHLLLLTSACQ